MNFEAILKGLYAAAEIAPVFFVGIECGKDRKNEYGTAKFLDSKGRGTKALSYHRFIFEELLPFIRNKYGIISFREKSFCGFSLGGLKRTRYRMEPSDRVYKCWSLQRIIVVAHG